MTLEITNGGGAQTLDIKQPEWQDRGWAVLGDVSTPGSGPLAMSINTGALGDGNAALSIASGDVLVDGEIVSYAGGTIDIDTGSAEARKDLIWIDNTGSIEVEKGQPATPEPTSASRFGTWTPGVPFPPTTPATCIGVVYVAGNATAVSTEDLQDRRLSANAVLSSMRAEQAVLADQASQPDAVSDKRVLYAKGSDGNIYKVNPDGSEEQLGGGGGIFEDTDADDIYEQTTGQGIQTPSVSTVELFTNPAGAILKQSSDQTIPSGTLTELSWDASTERNTSAPSFADLSNNQIVIPNDDYTVARITVGLDMGQSIAWDLFRPLYNGSGSAEGLSVIYPGGTLWRGHVLSSAWIPVSSGDTFSADFRHTEGSDQTTLSTDSRTFLSVEAI